MCNTEMDHNARTTKAAGNPAEKLKDIAEKLKDIAEKLKDAVEKLHTDANTALKDAEKPPAKNEEEALVLAVWPKVLPLL